MDRKVINIYSSNLKRYIDDVESGKRNYFFRTSALEWNMRMVLGESPYRV